MKVTLVQTDIIWQDYTLNIARVREMILSNPGSDLYILPEMWSSGFITNPDKEIILTGKKTLETMKQMADEANAAIVGSVPFTADDGSLRNRMFFVKPSTSVTSTSSRIEYYDKHHLFSPGGENTCYTAGNEKKTVEWRGIRFRLLVCYDLRFPVWSRNYQTTSPVDGLQSRADYDCLIYVASWPSTRHSTWQTLLQARAIENQCFVCGVNRVGQDPFCKYSGGTMLVNAYGQIVDQCPENKEGCITCSLTLDSLKLFREKFPVLLDAD